MAAHRNLSGYPVVDATCCALCHAPAGSPCVSSRDPRIRAAMVHQRRLRDCDTILRESAAHPPASAEAEVPPLPASGSAILDVRRPLPPYRSSTAMR